MRNKPFWRNEMELPSPDDFEKQQEYELAQIYDEDEEYYEDYTDRICPECGGSGGDRWNDGVVSCKFCHGAGYIG